MLEKLPEAVGHALRNVRAGLDQCAVQQIDLRQGTAAIGLHSPDFVDYGPLPVGCTADGNGLSPKLVWDEVPDTARSLVLLVEDADAPTPHPLVHAIAVDLPPDQHILEEGALAPGADRDEEGRPKVGRNSFLRAGWLPPDPPPGHGPHRYAFQLFALDDTPEFADHPGRDEVLDQLREHAIASGCMVGIYERQDGSIPQRTTRAEPAEEAPAEPVVVGTAPVA